MVAAGASVKDAAGKMVAADKDGAKFRAGLDTLGGAAGKVGLAAGVGLGAAVFAAAKFDSAMSKVQAATHETSANMDLLRDAALEAGAKTAFSATEAAAGIEELSKAGVSTKDVLAGGLTGALDLAAAGGIGVAEAAETAATALTQFDLAGADIPHVADLLAAAAGKAQGSVSDMGMALKQSGLVAAQVGLSIEETTGTLAAFASAGLTGSDAGTSFKTMLQSLTPTGAKAREEMDRLGISAYDAQGNFVGMEKFAGSLKNGLKDLSDEQQNAAMKTIFGTDAVRAAGEVFNQGAKGIGEWIEKVDDSGYAAETAAIRTDNLAGDLERFGGSLETALIGTGASSQGPLRSVVQSLEGVVNAYNNLGDAAKSGVALTLGATALLGGGIFVFSKVVQGVAATSAALTALGVTSVGTKAKMSAMSSFALGPWGAALAGAAVAVGLLYAESQKAGQYVDSFTATLDKSTGAITDHAGAMDTGAAGLKNLQSEGWLDYAEDVGISMTLVEDAILGVPGAMDELVAANNAAKDSAFNPFGNNGLSDDADQFIANVEGQVEALGKSQRANKQLRDATRGQDADARRAAGATEDYRNAVVKVGDSSTVAGGKVKKSAEQIKAAADRMKEAREAAQQTARSFITLGDGVNDAKVSLGQWIKQMANQADALRNFRVNAINAGEKGLKQGLIADLQAMGTEGALRMRQLANASESEIGRANKAWQSGQDEMRRYENFKVKPKKIEVDASQAREMIDSATRALQGIPDADPNINVKSNAGAAAAATVNVLNGIDDEEVLIIARRVGAITKGNPLLAAGGPIRGPGTATSDSVPVMASTGEYMMRAAAVDHYGQTFFDKANAMRLAGGGSVDGPAPTHPGKAPNEDNKKAYRRWERELAEWEKYVAGFKTVIGKFALEVDMSAQAMRRELGRLKDDLKDAGGEWTKELRTQAKGVRREQRQFNKAAERIKAAERKAEADVAAFEVRAEAALEAAEAKADADAQRMSDLVDYASERESEATSRLSDVLGERDSLASDVSGAFKTSVTGDGLRGLDKALTGDIAGRREMDSTLAQLVAGGLDTTGAGGGLYNELVRSGDTKTAGQLLAAGPGAIEQYEQLYGQRAALNDQAGALAGNKVFGEQIGRLSGELAVATAELVVQTAAMEKQIVDAKETGRLLEVELETGRQQLAAEIQANGNLLADELRTQRHELKQELREMKNDAKDLVPGRTGKAVGDEINAVVRNAGRR